MLPGPPLLVLALASLALPTRAAPLAADDGAGAEEAPAHLRVEKGPYELLFPRAETLTFRVRVGLVVVETPVGTVTMSSRVEPFREPVLLAPRDAASDPREIAHLAIRAEGDYAFYRMDSTIESRILPTDWPWIVYRTNQRGSENRRRELLLGWREGDPYARLRKDTSKGAPRGTRVWREPEDRVLPEVPLDLLSATYHARRMIREGLDEMRFPATDKLELWDVHLQRGERSVQRTIAGDFRCVEIVLTPQPYHGEDVDEEDREKFEGLFGIHGSIHLFVDEETGVPVRIQGDVPLGPFNVAVDVVLSDYAGTPAAFGPLGSEPR